MAKEIDRALTNAKAATGLRLVTNETSTAKLNARCLHTSG